MIYLDFEEPIRQLREQLASIRQVAEQTDVDMQSTVSELEEKIREVTRTIYGSLSAWQRVQVSRHPDRPYALSYFNALTDNRFMELHGDRTVKDDKAMVGGWGVINDQPVMLIGQQKGINTKLAEKFNRPVITFIDTPGAFPGLEAEERGQGEAIARNLIEMCQLRVPILCFIIGEGASGGALGIGIGDRVVMLENTWYSVISPESCSSILWRNWEHKVEAAEALKLTPEDMLGQGLIDGIVPEPLGGAHADPAAAHAFVKAEILAQLPRLLGLSPDKRVDARIRKFSAMGVVTD